MKSYLNYTDPSQKDAISGKVKDEDGSFNLSDAEGGMR